MENTLDMKIQKYQEEIDTPKTAIYGNIESGATPMLGLMGWTHSGGAHLGLAGDQEAGHWALLAELSTMFYIFDEVLLLALQ